MRRILQFSTLSLAAGVLTGCEPEHVVKTPVLPTAGVRFVHAVPDTGAMDFRFVDIVENSAHYNFTFRATVNLYYKPARAGQRHLRIFRAGTTADVASIVVKDTIVTLEAGKRYTFILWGFSRPGSSPPMRLTVIEDNPPDPVNQVALRAIHAGAGLGAVDVIQYARGTTGTACPGGVTPPTTPTWGALAEFSVTGYTLVSPGDVCFTVTPAGGGTAHTANQLALTGTPATIDIEAIPGTRVPGSAVSAIFVPRSVAGSQAPSFTTPGIIFVWDRRPPRCPLC
jgi:hypothetical protein